MPSVTIENNSRMALRIPPQDKAILMRAIAIEHTSLTEFVLRNALQAAKDVIGHAECIQLSERDSLRVLDFLENPPPPNAKLLEAAHALPPVK